MIEQLRIQNFKSWRDTGTIRFAPITGFFGANSSGKTSLLHFLLMLKQTVESTDRQQIIKLDGPYTELGTFEDLIYKHDMDHKLDFDIQIMNLEDIISYDLFLLLNDVIPRNIMLLPEADFLRFRASISEQEEVLKTNNLIYTFGESVTSSKSIASFDLKRDNDVYNYEQYIQYTQEFMNTRLKLDENTNSFKFYNFPQELIDDNQNLYFLPDLANVFEKNFLNMLYLGPLRDYPKRSYLWNGNQVSLGNQGENAVFVLIGDQKRTGKSSTEKTVAIWLQQLGLIHSFRVHRIVKNRRDYEVRIQIKEGSTEVLLTEVGFGVSQILPVLVLCATAEAGSTIILEQPEIHLHPAVQAGLADILIETSQRGVQVILESHSEHLLRRLQRRIAEAKLTPQETALYFCESDKTGTSQLKPLEVDTYGNINNWPEHFFGDEMGDLAAMTIAAMERQIAEGHQ